MPVAAGDAQRLGRINVLPRCSYMYIPISGFVYDWVDQVLFQGSIVQAVGHLRRR